MTNPDKPERLLHPVECYIGLGSNLDNPLQQVRQAMVELAQLPHSRLLIQSQLYRSDPVGPAGQPDYINAVAKLSCYLTAETLLDHLQAIEQLHQRVRQQHWGPRTLDLDILLFGDRPIATQRLSVPHPHMTERNFVLYPLLEIAPDLILPDGSPLIELIVRCDMSTLTPLGV